MKKLLLFSLIVALAMPVFARKQINAEEIFNAKVKSMQERLELTPEQLEKFVPIYRNYLTAVKNLPRPKRCNSSQNATCEETCNMITSRLEYKKSIITEQQKVIVDLKNVLTQNQLRKFLKVESKIQHKIRNAKMRRAKHKNNK